MRGKRLTRELIDNEFLLCDIDLDNILKPFIIPNEEATRLDFIETYYRCGGYSVGADDILKLLEDKVTCDDEI